MLPTAFSTLWLKAEIYNMRTGENGFPHAMLGDIVSMRLAIHSERSLIHKSGDVVFTLKFDLSPLQVLRCEVGLHMSDLNVRMLGVQARHVHLKHNRLDESSM